MALIARLQDAEERRHIQRYYFSSTFRTQRASGPQSYKVSDGGVGLPIEPGAVHLVALLEFDSLDAISRRSARQRGRRRRRSRQFRRRRRRSDGVRHQERLSGPGGAGKPHAWSPVPRLSNASAARCGSESREKPARGRRSSVPPHRPESNPSPACRPAAAGARGRIGLHHIVGQDGDADPVLHRPRHRAEIVDRNLGPRGFLGSRPNPSSELRS